jgi:chromosome segregation ATPase
MKARSPMVDGFEKSVAEKMPKMKKMEDPPNEMPLLRETVPDAVPEAPQEEAPAVQAARIEGEPSEDVMRLIEELHGQLLVSNQTKRTLETELTSYQRTIHQLGQDNRDLKTRLEHLTKEHERLRESQSELVYLQEENADALERIRRFQGELKELKEALNGTTRERDEALSRVQGLEFQMEQSEITRMKGRLKEREASQLADENAELRKRLEEILVQNVELEKKYEAIRKSFREVRESLTLLRNSCKRDFYNLPGDGE